MEQIPMEDFFHQTRQRFGLNECKMDNQDCRRDWKITGTLAGECLTYTTGDKMFHRDTELRISILGNDSGKRQIV